MVFSCSIVAAVSCNALACSSVRLDRSRLPVAICDDAVATLSLLPRTAATVRDKLSDISCNALRS